MIESYINSDDYINSNIFDESWINDISFKDLNFNDNTLNNYNSLTEYYNYEAHKKEEYVQQKKLQRRCNIDQYFSLLELLKRIPILTKDEEIQLFEQLRKGNEKEKRHAKNILTISNLYLIPKTLKTITFMGYEKIDIIDLFIEGYFGLDYAINHYNYFICNRFMSFAPLSIQRWIRRAIPTQAYMIKLPIHIYEQKYRINQLLDSGKITQDDSVEKIAKISGLPLDSVSKIIVDENKTINYQEKNFYNFPNDIDYIPDSSSNFYEKIEDTFHVDTIRDILKTLNHRERDVIIVRFGLEDSKERTLEEVGQLFGVTRERIRQIENKAISKIKSRLKTMYKYSFNNKIEDEMLHEKCCCDLFKNKNGVSYIPDVSTIAKKIQQVYEITTESEFIEKFIIVANGLGYKFSNNNYPKYILKFYRVK